MLTVQEYAEQRGCAPKTVYNALKKHGLITIDGVSNGKAAQILPDETIEQLNQIIRTTPQELSVLRQQLETREADYQLAISANKEAMQAKDELAREKDTTRELTLSRIEAVSADFKAQLSEIRSDYERRLSIQKEQFLNEKSKNDALQAENERLKKALAAAQDELAYFKAHPIKSAYAQIKEKKNGTLSEGNEGSRE